MIWIEGLFDQSAMPWYAPVLRERLPETCSLTVVLQIHSGDPGEALTRIPGEQISVATLNKKLTLDSSRPRIMPSYGCKSKAASQQGPRFQSDTVAPPCPQQSRQELEQHGQGWRHNCTQLQVATAYGAVKSVEAPE